MDNTPILLKVKDLDGNEKFKGLHPNLIPCPACVIIIGAIKSSKSNLIINFLCNPAFYKDKFSIVRVLSTTLHMDNKMKILDKHFNCDDHYEDKFIDEIIESQGKYTKEDRPTYCLVMDDILTSDFIKRSNKLAFFTTKMRHYIDMMVISSQSINHIPALIRAQSTSVLVGRQQNHKEKIKIMEQYGGLLGENGDKKFLELYDLVHSEPYQFMLIRVNENPVEVWKNFEVQIY
tara:strand:+ start:243 stop:941 length:699 start_codon:yes stop_codon:yes gene_type:complete